MNIEIKLLKIILETMFMVLLELDFSPPMKSDLRKKEQEYKDVLNSIK